MTKSIWRGFMALLLALALVIPMTATAEEPHKSSAQALQVESSQPSEQPNFEQADAYYQRTGGIAPGWLVVNYTITGALIGGAVGLGMWLLTGRDWSPWTIGQFAGGGAVLGAGLGVVRLLTRDDTAVVVQALERPNSVKFIEEQAPKAVKVPVLKLKF